jgi:hypothetical protein
MKTPIRSALLQGSALVTSVEDGLGAVKRAHTTYFDEAVREEFGDSLDLDEAMQKTHGQENRWDYLLGHGPSAEVIGLEPHSAKTDQISTVIAKRKAAMSQLSGHLKPGAQVKAWLWVASGNVDFADTERARIRLDDNGIRFVGRMVLGKHLPSAPPSKAQRRRSRRVT